MIGLTAMFLGGFAVNGLWAGIGAAIVTGVVSWIAGWFIGPREPDRRRRDYVPIRGEIPSPMAPPSGWLEACTRPPWVWAICCTIDMPRPLPLCWLRTLAGSPR